MLNLYVPPSRALKIDSRADKYYYQRSVLLHTDSWSAFWVWPSFIFVMAWNRSQTSRRAAQKGFLPVELLCDLTRCDREIAHTVPSRRSLTHACARHEWYPCVTRAYLCFTCIRLVLARSDIFETRTRVQLRDTTSHIRDTTSPHIRNTTM